MTSTDPRVTNAIAALEVARIHVKETGVAGLDERISDIIRELAEMVLQAESSNVKVTTDQLRGITKQLENLLDSF